MFKDQLEKLMSTIPQNLETDAVILPPLTFAPALLEPAMKARRSKHPFRDDSLSLETLSSQSWAACGGNRPDSTGSAAPSAHNWREIDVFAAFAQSACRYDPHAHRWTGATWPTSTG